jgi:hypothetical protein
MYEAVNRTRERVVRPRESEDIDGKSTTLFCPSPQRHDVLLQRFLDATRLVIFSSKMRFEKLFLLVPSVMWLKSHLPFFGSTVRRACMGNPSSAIKESTVNTLPDAVDVTRTR